MSTDVADTIEGMLPESMNMFAGSDEVVRFEPVGRDDEAAASQETDHVWWEEREEESRETYYDVTEDQFAMVAQAVEESDGELEIVAHGVHDGSGNRLKTEATS